MSLAFNSWVLLDYLHNGLLYWLFWRKRNLTEGRKSSTFSNLDDRAMLELKKNWRLPQIFDIKISTKPLSELSRYCGVLFSKKMFIFQHKSTTGSAIES